MKPTTIKWPHMTLCKGSTFNAWLYSVGEPGPKDCVFLGANDRYVTFYVVHYLKLVRMPLKAFRRLSIIPAQEDKAHLLKALSLDVWPTTRFSLGDRAKAIRALEGATNA